jgi:hypothetical protein
LSHQISKTPLFSLQAYSNGNFLAGTAQQQRKTTPGSTRNQLTARTASEEGFLFLAATGKTSIIRKLWSEIC